MSDDENVAKKPAPSPPSPTKRPSSVALKHIEPQTTYATPASKELLENDLVEAMTPRPPSPPSSLMNIDGSYGRTRQRRRVSGENLLKSIRRLPSSLGMRSPQPTDDEEEGAGIRAPSPTDSEQQLSTQIGLDLRATTQGSLKPKQEERMLRYVFSGAVEGQLSRSMPSLSPLTYILRQAHRCADRRPAQI